MSIEANALAALRSAASQRNWNGCLVAAEVVFSYLSVPQILRLAYNEVQRRLPLFERHHPYVQWPRIWLESILVSGYQSLSLDETSPEVIQETQGPGGANFTKAVIAIFLTVKSVDSLQCATYALEAIAEAIMAEMMEIGGTEQPEVWNQWYQDALTGREPSHPDALLMLMNNPKVAAAELAAWNRLVKDISTCLA